MSEIRLITLYKQHYLDDYSESLNSEYSCWGYYDGMDITKVFQNNSNIMSQNHSITPITDLWYKAGEKSSEITGQYGSIDIGIFRCMTGREADEQAIEFWKEKENSIFFGVAFLQLENREDFNKYKDFVNNIENKVQSKNTDKKCWILSYCTFDNADLVLLVHGNSLAKIEQDLHDIEENAEVKYQHSILGVSEQYLKLCKKKRKILSEWKGKECYIEEAVTRLDVRLVSSGESKIINIEKRILNEMNDIYKIKNLENMKYAYVAGHENWILTLEDTNVSAMLTFLLPGGFTTHQNESYKMLEDKKNRKSYPKLYNIETSYILDSSFMCNIPLANRNKNLVKKSITHKWFKEKMNEYRDFSRKALVSGDESLYSYYLAIMKTLNTLVQYEGFELSRDIFYMIYPSFEMFDKKLKRALGEANKIKYKGNNSIEQYDMEMARIKNSICDYVEAVNSVIYHSIHTDQIYLMIPGYSGTSFSIPIKLNMIFLWLTDCIARIFENEQRKYRCILVPTMESTPRTKRIQIERQTDDFLVYVKISQRTLYMPQELMIILVHEMGHYVGGYLRRRQIRAEKLKEFTAQKLVDTIFSDITEEDAKFQSIKEKLLLRIKNKTDQCYSYIQENYYGDDVEKALQAVCRFSLNNYETWIKEIVCDVYFVPEENEKLNNQFYKIEQMISRTTENANDILVNNIMKSVIQTEMYIYKECFSDLLALKLLQFHEEEFKNALRVSEGKINYQEIDCRRENILFAINNLNTNCLKQNDEVKKEDIELIDYARECSHFVDEQLGKNNKLLGEIRNLYNAFTCDNDIKDGDIFCQKIYNIIIKYISNMESDIEKEIIHQKNVT